jgi:Mg-chelatase subunit ChlD
MLSFRQFTAPASLFIAGISAVGVLSCSASAGTGPSQQGGTGGSSSGSGGAPAAGATGSGGAMVSGSGDTGGIIVIQTGGTSSTGPDAGCNKEVHQGERQPLDMYFLVDQSGSMKEGNPSKWAAVSMSLSSFLGDAANAGTGAGIGYFPIVPNAMAATCTMDQNGMNGCVCLLGFCINTNGILNVGGSCTVSDYATPDVPIAQLPAVAPMIQTSLQAHGPGGGTPTYPALQGAYQYTAAWAKMNPGRRTVLVLATDGDPTGCDTTNAIPNIGTDLVAPALAGTPSISTFVIGVGSSLTSLNDLAKAGGTNQAFIVDTGGDVAKQFAMALDAIRGQAASCNFSVPSDGTVDSSKVNATYTPPGAAATDVLGVADQNACTANDPYWYFSPDKKQLILCPNMCNTLSQKGGSVQVVLGCPTKTPITR